MKVFYQTRSRVKVLDEKRLSTPSLPKGVFVWRCNRVDGKFWREYEEEKLFGGCLVEGGEGKWWWGPPKVFSPKWSENLVGENLIGEGQKCPCASCTWASSIWFFFFFYFLDVIFFFYTWFLFFNKFGWLYFLVVCHFFVSIGHHFLTRV